MDLSTLHRRTVETWTGRIDTVSDDQWLEATPCADWTVRDLVNHVVGEDLWTVPLMRGETIGDVGDRLEGDLLGDDPRAAARAAADESTDVVADVLPRGGIVHLSYGDEKMDEYIHQLAADHLIHAWDLAAATGGDMRLDDELVEVVATWFEDREALYRSGGVVGPRVEGMGGDRQSDLLARFGRAATWAPADAALRRFSAAFGSGDVDAIMALMTDDCVFESTGPAPDGVRHEGADAVRHVWETMFAETTDAAFTEEESFVCGDRAVLRWQFSWTDAAGTQGHVRGVDVLRLRDGRVAEKLSYVKG